jgi:hypothetical protein
VGTPYIGYGLRISAKGLSKGTPDFESGPNLLIYLKQAHTPSLLTPPRLALPPEKFENTGAGLEPKKQYGKPFRRDPKATEIRFQADIPYLVTTHPKGRTTLLLRWSFFYDDCSPATRTT